MTRPQGEITGNLAVPADFLGICAQDWPHTASPAPAFSFGHYHTIDNKRVHWNPMDNGAGVFDFTNMNTLVNASGMSGKTVSYCHMGTPAALAPADMQVQGPYSNVGEMAPPTSYATLPAYFAGLLTTRPQITVVQPGNEPTFSGVAYATFTADAGTDAVTSTWSSGLAVGTQVFLTTTGTLPAGLLTNTVYFLLAGTTSGAPTAVQLSLTNGGAAIDITGTGSGTHTMRVKNVFWWGTPEQLVDYCFYTMAAARAARPGITCTTPGVYDPTSFAQFLDATGTLCGLKGSQLQYDGLALHPYTSEPNLRTFQQSMDITTQYLGGINAFTKIMTDRGMPPLPVYMTEYGLASRSVFPRVPAFNALSAAQQRSFTARMGAAAARNRVRQFSFFSFNSASNLCGDMTVVGGSGYGIGDAHNALAGKTLMAGAGYDESGVESGRLSDGTSYAF